MTEIVEIEDTELETLKAGAAKAVELEAEKAKLAEDYTKEKEALIKEREELKIQVNPNWSKLREKEERLVTALKAQGKEVDVEGNLIEEKKISMEDVEQRASASARKEMLNARKDELLEDYTADERKVLDVYYDKLTAGEAVTMGNVKTFVQQAARAAFHEDENKAQKVLSGGGRPPRVVEQPKVSDERAKQLAEGLGIKI